MVAQVKTNRPAKEPYASMSSADKQKVQKKLVENLKGDTDLIAMDKIMSGVVNENMKKRKGTKASSVDKNSNTPEAKKRREDLLEVMIKTLTLMKKYPELGQLDSETRKEVLKQARSKKGV